MSRSQDQEFVRKAKAQAAMFQQAADDGDDPLWPPEIAATLAKTTAKHADRVTRKLT